MNRMLTIICLAGILMTALALGAHASEIATEDTWKLYLVAASAGDVITPYTNAGPAFAASATTDTVLDDVSTKDPLDGGEPGSVGGKGMAVGGFYRPWGPSGAYGVFLRDYRQPVAAPSYYKEWKDFVMYITDLQMPPYPSENLRLIVGGSGVPNSIGGMPVEYKLKMTFHPASYVGTTEWTLPPYPAPDSTTKTHWFYVDFPAAGAICSSPFVGTGPLAATQVYGYRFDLIVTPEPASLLALGTGLIGFAGLVRRRKS